MEIVGLMLIATIRRMGLGFHVPMALGLPLALLLLPSPKCTGRAIHSRSPPVRGQLSPSGRFLLGGLAFGGVGIWDTQEERWNAALRVCDLPLGVCDHPGSPEAGTPNDPPAVTWWDEEVVIATSCHLDLQLWSRSRQRVIGSIPWPEARGRIRELIHVPGRGLLVRAQLGQQPSTLWHLDDTGVPYRILPDPGGTLQFPRDLRQADLIARDRHQAIDPRERKIPTGRSSETAEETLEEHPPGAPPPPPGLAG